MTTFSSKLPLIGIYCLSILTATTAGFQCFSCRGINCFRTTLQNKYETCQNNLDSCVTIFDKFAIAAKGCLMNMPVELRTKCDNIEDPECQLCTGELCNNMGRKDFKCYQCDERDHDNSKCATNIEAFTPKQCSEPTTQNSYCYTKTYKGFTVRGCSLHAKEQIECLSNPDCTLCLAQDAEGCNSRTMMAAGVSKVSSAVFLVMFCASISRIIFKF